MAVSSINNPGKRALRLSGALLLVVGVAACSSKAEPGAKKAAGVPVSAITVEKRNVEHWADGIGSVTPLQDVVLRAQVSGVLAEVLFREGDNVRRGQLLAKLDDREYAAALLQAQAEKARNESQLRAAQQDLDRYHQLVTDGSVSRRTVDQQEAMLDQLRATIRANDAAITVAQVQLSYTRIVSPIDGRVGLRRIDAGNLVQPSDAQGLVTITQMHPISVVFSLPQQQLPLIRHLVTPEAGAKPAAVSAADRDGGEPLGEGKLSMIDNTIDSGTGMVRLRAQFDNDDARLWPGQFVTARLHTGTSVDALVLPARAVRQGLNGAFVYRVNGKGDDSKAEFVKVSTGFQDDAIVVITDGLAAGDQVVTDGHSRIKPGAAIRVLDTPKS